MSAQQSFDVVGVGNALVDVLTHATLDDLAALGLEKDVMTLVDAEQSHALYARMGPAVEASGGSCANTIVGIASLGGSPAFIGRVAPDQAGEVFQHDIRAAGVAFDGMATDAATPTGRCLIFITPDAHRTMQTFLGTGAELSTGDVPEATVRAAQITYLEGYLFDRDSARDAFRAAARIAHEAGRKVALTLSDPFCVERHRAEFLALLRDNVDVLFANEHEIMSLFEVDDFDAAAEQARGACDIAALTRSAAGSVIVAGSATHVIPAEPVAAVVDTTGAGDLYAAGVLFGLTRGLDLGTCGGIGAIAAAEVISHIGPRPMTSLARLIEGIVSRS